MKTHRSEIGLQAGENAAGPEDHAPPEDPHIMQEFLLFLRETRKWWMIPIVVLAVLMGILLTLSATPLGPFIYGGLF